MGDPLDKLVQQGDAPKPARHKRPKKAVLKRPKSRTFSFTLSLKQSIVFERVSKHIGISAYIRNLIRRDMENQGEIWPDDLIGK